MLREHVMGDSRLLPTASLSELKWAVFANSRSETCQVKVASVPTAEVSRTVRSGFDNMAPLQHIRAGAHLARQGKPSQEDA